MKVTLENLTKIFPSRDKKSGKEVIAVNNFTYELPDGKLNPSGFIFIQILFILYIAIINNMVCWYVVFSILSTP